HHLLVELGLLLRHAMHEHREAPWRAVTLYPARSEAQGLEPRAHPALELLERRGHVGGRQLLGTELEKEIARSAGVGGFLLLAHSEFTAVDFGTHFALSSASLMSG